MTTKALSRRTFLRGTLAGGAIAIAVPPLEAMLTDHGAFADDPDPQPYFGVFFWANGLPWHDGHGAAQAGHADLWTPGASTGPIDWGAAPELLAPLAPHQVSVVTGLEPKTEIPSSPAGQGDGHMRGFMVALTGDRPRAEGFDHGSHTLTALRPSLDQYVAKHEAFYAGAPRFRSLQIGVSEARFHEYGHWNAISYNGPDSLNPAIMRPTELFDQLFHVPANVDSLRRRASVLDAVMADAARLRARLGARDRERLEAHLDHIGTIQGRLAQSAVTCDAPARPADTGDLMARAGVMADLLGVALACGLTRAFSFMLTSPATTHVFDNVGVANGMHKVCHDGHWEDVRRVTRYQIECFAHVLERLGAVTFPTGETLLDRGLILGTSEYGEGYKHGNREHPFVFAGTAHGRVQRSMHARRPLGNMSLAHVTALRAVGIPAESYGFHGGETSDELGELLV